MSKCCHLAGCCDWVLSGPQRFQNFACHNTCTWDKRRGKSVQTILLVCMNMKEPDCLIDSQANQQQIFNPEHQVNNVLTDDIIKKNNSLFQINSGCPN